MLGLITGGLAMLGGAVVGCISSLGAGLITTIGILLSVDKIVEIIMSIGKKIGLVQDEKELEELGDKVVQAEEEGIVLEKFKSWDEYKKEIEKFEIDETKSLKTSIKDKMIVGLSYCLKDIENFKEFPVGDLLEIIKNKPELLTEEKIDKLIDKLKENNYSAMDIKDYYDGNLNVENEIKIDKILKDIEEN